MFTKRILRRSRQVLLSWSALLITLIALGLCPRAVQAQEHPTLHLIVTGQFGGRTELYASELCGLIRRLPVRHNFSRITIYRHRGDVLDALTGGPQGSPVSPAGDQAVDLANLRVALDASTECWSSERAFEAAEGGPETGTSNGALPLVTRLVRWWSRAFAHATTSSTSESLLDLREWRRNEVAPGSTGRFDVITMENLGASIDGPVRVQVARIGFSERAPQPGSQGGRTKYGLILDESCVLELHVQLQS